MADFDYNISDRNIGAARKILRIIKERLPFVKIHTVIDVGCGIGQWLSVARKDFGTTQVKGLDIIEYDSERFLIKSEEYEQKDLNEIYITKQKYDLATSLETAEHLRPESADNIVTTLCNASNLVLFSAAMPNQGGIGHLNEQYWEYWIELFSKKNFVCVDFIRKEIWDNPNISACYKNNILLFIKSSVVSRYYSDKYRFRPCIHPELYGIKVSNFYKGKQW